MNRLRGTLKAVLLNDQMEQVEELQVRDLRDKLSNASGVKAVVFDGVVTQELADLAAEKGVSFVVGVRSRIEKAPKNVRIMALDELRRQRYQR